MIECFKKNCLNFRQIFDKNQRLDVENATEELCFSF